jgi:opacity protein-like surface antigen
MKKSKLTIFILLVLLAVLLFTACAPAESDEEPAPQSPETETNGDLSGRYVGYSWGGEADGTSFEEAEQYIETILELDENGIITDAKMLFFVQMDGFWIPRQSGNAYVDIDYTIEPSEAVPGENYEPGESMFTVYTADMMSFYAAGVSEDGIAAAMLVDPITRYMFEYRFDENFDYSTLMEELTIGREYMTPTIRTSSSGLVRPDNWEDFEGGTIFTIDPWSHVVNERGILEGIDDESTVQEFLQTLGIEFAGGTPQQTDPVYGYFGNEGWAGNYTAIEEDLIGQDATQKTSLVDWSVPRYAGAVNEDNVFGVDVEAGATRTVQNSIDTISGATVRISRESTSYQRALVQAGIISEADVIIGRF